MQLSFSVGNDSFIIKTAHSSSELCLTFNGTGRLTTVTCNPNSPFQQWIRTPHGQLVHVNTTKCVQQGPDYPQRNDSWYLDLEECTMTEEKQLWDYESQFFRKLLKKIGDHLYINLDGKLVVATLSRRLSGPPQHWKCSTKSDRKPATDGHCPSSMLIIYSITYSKGLRGITDLFFKARAPKSSEVQSSKRDTHSPSRLSEINLVYSPTDISVWKGILFVGHRAYSLYYIPLALIFCSTPYEIFIHCKTRQDPFATFYLK